MSTRLNKGRQGKRELFISCLGCSEKAKNVTYKGTEGVIHNPTICPLKMIFILFLANNVAARFHL